jgi:hypothetical protein
MASKKLKETTKTAAQSAAEKIGNLKTINYQ